MASHPRRLRALLVVILLASGAVAVTRHVADRRRSDAILRADPDTVLAQPRLARTALDIGKPAFERRCAGCHGSHGTGDKLKFVPDLSDDDDLYGSGRATDIEQIVLHGIRAGSSRGKTLADMPAYAREKPYAGEPIEPLTPAEIADVTQYVRSLSGKSSDRAAGARGRVIYHGQGGCYDCHGGDGRGDTAIGAPNLADSIWLYGGSTQAIADSVAYGRAGICPAFGSRITALEARAIAIYTASLRR